MFIRVSPAKAAVSWRQDLSFPQQEAQGPAGEGERHKQA